MVYQATGQVKLSEKTRKYIRLGTNRNRGDLHTDVLEAVRKTLRQGSYPTLTVEKVAAETGISRRTLYNLFVDKNDMFTKSCEHLIASLSELVIDEIPERMTPLDGVRFYIASCFEVYGSEEGRDLMLTVVRDGAQHPWLSQAYYRKVQEPLLRAFELFVLKNTRLAPMPSNSPRQMGMQILSVVKLQAIRPMIFDHSFAKPRLCRDEQELLAQVYASIWLIGKSVSLQR